MPLSRAQILRTNDVRKREIDAELEDLQRRQQSTGDKEEQREILDRQEALLREQTSLEAANSVLADQLQEAKKEEEERILKKWEEEERPAFREKFEQAADLIEKRLEKALSGYKDLLDLEDLAKDAWIQRGRPGKPAKSLSERSFAGFLGVQNSHPVSSLRGRRRRINRIFATGRRSK